MKHKIFYTILILSLLFNITIVWNYINSNGILNANDTLTKFDIIKANISGVEENLKAALATEDTTVIYKNIYRANRKLLQAYYEAKILEPAIYQRYLVDTSPFVSYLFEQQENITIIQENIISTGFQKISKEDSLMLEEIATKVMNLNSELKQRTLKRKDLNHISSELFRN